MCREQLLLLGVTPLCFIPSPKSTSPKHKSSPSKAGAGKSFVPPKSAIKQILSSWSCAGLQSHPVQPQKLLIALQTLREVLNFSHPSWVGETPAGITSLPPILTSCLTSTFHPQQTQREIGNASDKPQKEPKGGSGD